MLSQRNNQGHLCFNRLFDGIGRGYCRDVDQRGIWPEILRGLFNWLLVVLVQTTDRATHLRDGVKYRKAKVRSAALVLRYAADDVCAVGYGFFGVVGCLQHGQFVRHRRVQGHLCTNSSSSEPLIDHLGLLIDEQVF